MYFKFYREYRLIIYTDKASFRSTVTKHAPFQIETDYTKRLLTHLLQINGLVLVKQARQCPTCVQSEILKTITTGIHKHNWIVLGNLRSCTPAKLMFCFCTKFHVSDPSRLSVSPPYQKIKRISFAPSPDLCYTLHKNIHSQEVLCFQKP